VKIETGYSIAGREGQLTRQLLPVSWDVRLRSNPYPARELLSPPAEPIALRFNRLMTHKEIL